MAFLGTSLARPVIARAQIAVAQVCSPHSLPFSLTVDCR